MFLSLDEITYRKAGIGVAALHVLLPLILMLLALNFSRKAEPVLMMAQIIDRESVAITPSVHVRPVKDKQLEKDKVVKDSELAAVPDDWIAIPWDMPANVRHQFGLAGATDYPAPLVDFKQAHRSVKADIAALRSGLGLQAAPGFNERPRQNRRATRTAPRLKQEKSKPSAQLDLF